MNANVTTAAPPVAPSTGTPNTVTNNAPPVKGDPTIVNAGKESNVENNYKGSKHKVKVDGKELDIDYDDLVSGYQLKNASLNKMNEAAKQEQLARDVLKRFSAKDVKAFEQLGIDPVEWAETILQSKVENELLSPEQREKRDLLAKIKTYEDEKKSVEDAKQQAEFQKAFNFHAQDLDTKFTEALKTAKVPKTPATIRRMAYHMLQANNAGVDVDPADVISMVKQEYQEEHQQMWSESDIDQLYSQFGEANVNKLIKMHNDKMTKGNPTPSRQRASGDARPAPKAGKGKAAPKSMENTFKAIRDRYS